MKLSLLSYRLYIPFKTVILLVFSFWLNNHTQAQTIDSSYQMASTGISSVEAITTDQQGNVYVAGYFKDSVWVNETHLIKGSASVSALYFAAYAPDNSLLFKKLMYTNSLAPIQLETDDSGFVYMGSLYSQTKMYLDLENQKDDIYAGYGQQAFILKVNSSGDNLWHISSSGTKTKTNVESSEFTLTEYGHIIWMCSAKGGVSINTSIRYNYSGFGSIGNEQSNRTGSFILRTDPNSTMRYPKALIGNSDAIVRATSITEKDGNIYFGGQLNGTVDFDITTGTKEITLSGKAFYCSLDTQMNLRWVKPSPTLHRFSKITINAFDQIKCYGSYAGVGSSNFEMSSLLTDGEIMWEAIESFSSVSLQINDCKTDRGGNTFVCGTFAGSGDFDPTANSQRSGVSNNAAFLVKYDSSGSADWVIVGSGTGSYTNRGNAVHLSENNQLFWGGVYSRTFNFSGSGNQNLPYTTHILGFVTQLTECKSLKPSINPSNTALCLGEEVTLTIIGAQSASWLDGSFTSLERTVAPNNSAKYSALVSNDSGCYKTVTAQVTANQNPSPTITFANNLGTVTGNWVKINWYLDGQLVPNETGINFEPNVNGQLYCIVEDSNGCKGKSNEIQFTLVSVFDIIDNGYAAFYHENSLVINMSNATKPVTLSLYNLTGKICKSMEIEVVDGQVRIPLELKKSAYILVLSQQNSILYRQRILVY